MISIFNDIYKLSNNVINLRLVSIKVSKDLNMNTHTLF